MALRTDLYIQPSKSSWLSNLCSVYFKWEMNKSRAFCCVSKSGLLLKQVPLAQSCSFWLHSKGMMVKFAAGEVESRMLSRSPSRLVIIEKGGVFRLL
jgi:hypothetical protein